MSDRNMKLSCDVIQDLLLLYDDDICCEATRKIVEEHLAGCEACRGDRLTALIPSAPEPPVKKEKKAVKSSFKKVHRRWIASILAVLMLFPLTAMIVLGYNEVSGKGRALSNWSEIEAGEEVLEMLAEGDYDGVLERTTFHSEYEEAVRRSERTFDEYMEEGYCSHYQEITINGETMVYMADWLDDNIPDSGFDWEWLIYSDYYSDCFIPEDIFKEITGVNNLTVNSDGIATVQVKGEYYQPVTYYRLETKWGNLMVSEGNWDVLHQGVEIGIADELLSPENLIYPVVAPKSLYLDTVEAMKESSRSDYKRLTEDYGRLIANGEEAFYADIAEIYKNKLKALDDRVFEITNITYDSSHRVDGEWIVSYYVTLDCQDGAVVPYDYTIQVDFKTYDGKVRFAGFSYNGISYTDIGGYNQNIQLFTNALRSEYMFNDMIAALHPAS